MIDDRRTKRSFVPFSLVFPDRVVKNFRNFFADVSMEYKSARKAEPRQWREIFFHPFLQLTLEIVYDLSIASPRSTDPQKPRAPRLSTPSDHSFQNNPSEILTVIRVIPLAKKFAFTSKNTFEAWINLEFVGGQR